MKQENHSYTMTIGTPQAREAVLQHFGHNKGLKADDVHNHQNTLGGNHLRS
jgi:aspartate/methionine/tyrosine aminotransferase